LFAGIIRDLMQERGDLPAALANQLIAGFA
jgi:hypothetical protein